MIIIVEANWFCCFKAAWFKTQLSELRVLKKSSFNFLFRKLCSKRVKAVWFETQLGEFESFKNPPWTPYLGNYFQIGFRFEEQMLFFEAIFLWSRQQFLYLLIVFKYSLKLKSLLYSVTFKVKKYLEVDFQTGQNESWKLSWVWKN